MLPHANSCPLGSTLGSILFGGVDSAKFNGPLNLLPRLTDDEYSSSYAVPWTSAVIGVYGSDGQDAANQTYQLNVGAVLDTGTSSILLPQDLYQGLGQALGIDPNDPNPDVCQYANEGFYFSATFNNDPATTITINGSDIIKQKIDSNGDAVFSTDGSPVCASPFGPTDSSHAILGSPFLQAAYMAVDNDNSVIGLAQAKINATDNSVVACSSTSAGFPGASGKPSLSVSLTTFTPGPSPTKPPQVATSSVVSVQSATPTLAFLSTAKPKPTGSTTSGAAPSATTSKAAASLNLQAPITAVSLIPLFMSCVSVLVGGVAFLL